jgi:hypothetical protein
MLQETCHLDIIFCQSSRQFWIRLLLCRTWCSVQDRCDLLHSHLSSKLPVHHLRKVPATSRFSPGLTFLASNPPSRFALRHGPPTSLPASNHAGFRYPSVDGGDRKARVVCRRGRGRRGRGSSRQQEERKYPQEGGGGSGRRRGRGAGRDERRVYLCRRRSL